MVWKMEEKVAKLIMTFITILLAIYFTSRNLTCHKVGNRNCRGQIVEGRFERLVLPAAE
jgi:hypothetical protein